MTINEILFNTLIKKGLKQADLAKYLNVEKSVITAWKRRGTDPPASYLVQICTFLDISIYELLGISENNFDQNLLKAFHNAGKETQENILAILKLQANNNFQMLENSSISQIG